MNNSTLPQLLPFDFALLRTLLGDEVHRFDVEHFDECSSTNTLMLEKAASGAPTGAVIVADLQTAGRGRRGRSWQSTPGYSLTFSLLWLFSGQEALAGVSLVVGVAVTLALEKMDIQGLALKWPNDIYLLGRKLGGVLVETHFCDRGVAVVIGVGLNLRPNPQWEESVTQQFAALSESDLELSREQVLAALLRELSRVLGRFAVEGFAAWKPHWQERHAFQDLPVSVLADDRECSGICRGVNNQGALLLESDNGQIDVWHGDVSLRPHADSGKC